jgi:hypothetical protein
MMMMVTIAMKATMMICRAPFCDDGGKELRYDDDDDVMMCNSNVSQSMMIEC